MLSIIHFGFRFFKEKFHRNNFPNDLIDEYFAKILPIIFLLFAIILTTKDYIFQNLVCVIPKLWIRAHEEYSKAMCWADSTYFMNINNKSPANNQELDKLKIKYYQYVPLFIVCLAVGLIIPRNVWKLFCGPLGIDIIHTIEIFSTLSQYGTKNQRKIIIYIENKICSKSQIISREDSRANFVKSNKRNGRFLPHIVFYIVLKLFYIGLAIGEIFLIQIFLGMKNIYFPIQMFLDSSRNIEWSTTGNFPIVTWCRIMIKDNRDNYARNIQCTLPWNTVHDKLFIIIWMSLVVGIVLMCFNISYWIIEIFCPSQQKLFIRNLLIYTKDLLNKKVSVKAESFVHNFIGYDGLFLLHNLQKINKPIYFQKIFENLWNSFSFQTLTNPIQSTNNYDNISLYL